MKISTKVRYGLRAMIEIAEHSNDSAPVMVSFISERQQLSRKYLENLLILLKRAGLIRSIRGAKGGYCLCKSPDDITVDEIFFALDDPPFLMECIHNTAICDRSDFCDTIDVWKKISDAAQNAMKKITLAELCKNKKSTSSERAGRCV